MYFSDTVGQCEQFTNHQLYYKTKWLTIYKFSHLKRFADLMRQRIAKCRVLKTVNLINPLSVIVLKVLGFRKKVEIKAHSRVPKTDWLMMF